MLNFEEELKNILATYLVVELENEVLGYLGMWFIIDECHVTNIAVKSKYRRKGIATKLIKEMFKLCKEQCISYAFLEVRISNLSAQKLYERFGFKSEGIRKEYYKNPDGSYEDALLMTKEF